MTTPSRRKLLAWTAGLPLALAARPVRAQRVLRLATLQGGSQPAHAGARRFAELVGELVAGSLGRASAGTDDHIGLVGKQMRCAGECRAQSAGDEMARHRIADGFADHETEPGTTGHRHVPSKAAGVGPFTTDHREMDDEVTTVHPRTGLEGAREVGSP